MLFSVYFIIFFKKDEKIYVQSGLGYVNVALKIYDWNSDPTEIIEELEPIVVQGGSVNLCGTMLYKFFAPVERYLNIRLVFSLNFFLLNSNYNLNFLLFYSRCITISEFDSIGLTFGMLKHEKDIFEQNDLKVVENAQRHLVPVILALAPFESYHLNNFNDNISLKTIQLPCMIVNLGASCLFLKVRD